MARKKSQRGKRRVIPQKKEKRFSCLECNREQMVVCALDHSKCKGLAKCLLCNYIFECPINRLSQAIDVYAAWVDYKEHKKEKTSIEKDKNAK